jgi:acyl carrier protein
MNETKERVIKVISMVLGIPVSQIEMDTEIGEPDEWDSLRNMQIFAELEKEFSLVIFNEMLVDLEYVSDIVELIENLQRNHAEVR